MIYKSTQPLESVTVLPMKSSPFGCLFGIAIIVSATSPVRATIFINDGTTVSITSSGNATDDYDTDHQPAAGGGVLEIDTSGNLVFSNARTIFNTHGEGVTRILGTLTQSAGSPGTVASDVQLESGGTIRSISSDLLLTAAANTPTRWTRPAAPSFSMAASTLSALRSLRGPTISERGPAKFLFSARSVPSLARRRADSPLRAAR